MISCILYEMSHCLVSIKHNTNKPWQLQRVKNQNLHNPDSKTSKHRSDHQTSIRLNILIKISDYLIINRIPHWQSHHKHVQVSSNVSWPFNIFTNIMTEVRHWYTLTNIPLNTFSSGWSLFRIKDIIMTDMGRKRKIKIKGRINQSVSNDE